MTYLPADSLRPFDLADLAELKGPALFLHDGGGRLLVAGGFAIFLGGNYHGHGFEQPRHGTYIGAITDQLDVEVDVSSLVMERPKTALDLQMRNGELLIRAAVKVGGFTEAKAIQLRSPVVEESVSHSVFFTRWRLIKAVGSDRIVVEEIVARAL